MRDAYLPNRYFSFNKNIFDSVEQRRIVVFPRFSPALDHGKRHPFGEFDFDARGLRALGVGRRVEVFSWGVGVRVVVEAKIEFGFRVVKTVRIRDAPAYVEPTGFVESRRQFDCEQLGIERGVERH